MEIYFQNNSFETFPLGLLFFPLLQVLFSYFFFWGGGVLFFSPSLFPKKKNMTSFLYFTLNQSIYCHNNPFLQMNYCPLSRTLSERIVNDGVVALVRRMESDLKRKEKLQKKREIPASCLSLYEKNAGSNWKIR